MPRKITNYLTEGLPAKIYLHCYLEPQSGYSLAVTFYGKPTAAKIYRWTKKMIEKGYLSYDSKEEEFSAKSAPLVSELKSILKSKGLNIENAEYRDLVKLVESDRIKGLVRKYREAEKNREFNILTLVCETISTFAALTYFLKTVWQIADLSPVERKKITQEIEKMNSDGTLPAETYPEAVAVMNEIIEEMFKSASITRPESKADPSLLSDFIQFGFLQFITASKSFLETLSQLTQAGTLFLEMSKLAMAIPTIIEFQNKLNTSHDNPKGAKK